MMYDYTQSDSVQRAKIIDVLHMLTWWMHMQHHVPYVQTEYQLFDQCNAYPCRALNGLGSPEELLVDEKPPKD